ncbi:MAG: DUF4034 domain-containing protein [Planctomycetaceae bacterium]|nr:DUF4034 domain-containing protein [Planctomycetaceae bacterium]
MLLSPMMVHLLAKTLPAIAMTSFFIQTNVEETETSEPLSSEHLIERVEAIAPRSEVVWKSYGMVPSNGIVQRMEFSASGKGLAVAVQEFPSGASGKFPDNPKPGDRVRPPVNIVVVNADNAEQLGTFEVPGRTRCMALSPDNQHLAIGHDKVDIYEVATGKSIFTHEAFDGDVSYVAISQDGKWLVGADGKGRILRFPLLGGQGEILDVDKEGRPLKAIRYATRADHVLYTLADGSIHFLSFQKTESDEPFHLHLNENFVNADSFAMGTDIFLVSNEDGLTRVSINSARTGLFGVGWSFSLAPIAGFEVAPDDSLLACWTADGQIQIVDSDRSSLFVTSRPPINAIQALFGRPKVVLSPDCSLMAFGGLKQIELWKMANNSLARPRQLQEFAEELLDSAQYDRLNQLAKMAFAYDDSISEEELFAAVNPTNVKSRTDDRVAQLISWAESSPLSPAPRIALAEHYRRVAWSHRGSGYANTVSEEQFREFEYYINKALTELGLLEPGASTPHRYYSLMLSLQTSASASRESFDETVDDVLRFCPENIDAHLTACYHLMPRWHGEPGDVARYAERVRAAVPEDKHDRILVAIVADQLRFYATDNFFTETGFKYDALKPKFQQLLKESDDDVPFQDRVVAAYAGIARRADDRDGAIEAGEVIMSKAWLTRNKANAMQLNDVNRTLLYVKQIGGQKAILEGLLKDLPKIPDSKEKSPPQKSP